MLILPQRQTALVAKQAAEVDILSGGRLRLGIGTGWNFVEYEALNEDWETRGARQAEQVALMRRLWTEELVTAEGRWHGFADAGLNPLPVQRPIPVWFGGTHPAVLRRAAKTATAGFPSRAPTTVAGGWSKSCTACWKRKGATPPPSASTPGCAPTRRMCSNGRPPRKAGGRSARAC